MTNGDFTKPTIETIAKRAANLCSNPDCGVLTCGPADRPDKSLTIGEAAHIFGSRPGSARFKESSTDAERSDITNAIWLCRNCHKLIDSDPSQFPFEALYEWRRQHEERVTAQLGKPTEIIQRKITMKQLEEFNSSSYLAQQIVIDKPDYWEYKLTIELLRTQLAPLQARWRSLKKGLYVRPSNNVPEEEFIDWQRASFNQIEKLSTAFAGLINEEIHSAWGPPGVPGSESEILRVCNLITECAAHALQWEESVQFSVVPTFAEEIQALLSGTAGQMIDSLSTIPIELSKIFEADDPSGTYHITLTISLPEGWSDRYHSALENAYGVKI